MLNENELKQTKEEGGEMKSNPINAAKFIESMMNIGYENCAALCDIIDNSIDAKAQLVKIKIEKADEKMKITIIDDGIGMSKEILEEALRFGSETQHEENSDLGKFGMGLTTAGLSLAEKTTVLTKNLDGIIFKGVTDVNEIRKRNELVKWMGTPEICEKELFEKELGKDSTGTIIIFENCTGVKYKNCSNFANTLIKEVGRIFRKYLDKVHIFINEKAVTPNDWLFEGDSRTKIISDEIYDINWKNKKGEEESGHIRIKFALLPNFDSKLMKEKNISVSTQGFSILRNNREIAYNVLNRDIGGRVRDNHLNRFRGEISFDDSCDYAMGVNFQKNGIEIEESVLNSLRLIINNTITTIGKMADSERNAKINPEEEDIHNQALEVIEKNQNILVDKPTLLIEKRKGRSKEELETKEDNNKKDEKENNDPSKRVRIAKRFQNKPGIPNAKFEFKEYDRTSNIFFSRLEGKTVIITFNTAHPFYERFIKDNTDNANLVSAVDYLLYCMGLAQLSAIVNDEDKAEFFEDYMQSISTNMRKFLE